MYLTALAKVKKFFLAASDKLTPSEGQRRRYRFLNRGKIQLEFPCLHPPPTVSIDLSVLGSISMERRPM